MVHSIQFVASVKCGNRFLQEMKNEDGLHNVFLPFGSEYQIFLKNLNTKKANVRINIDGEDVLDGNSLLVYPNDHFILDGFLKRNIVKNRFKFIEKTEKISDYRGDKIDDGIIRIEFAYEAEEKKEIVQKDPNIKISVEPQKIVEEHHHYHYDNIQFYHDPISSTNASVGFDSVQATYSADQTKSGTLQGNIVLDSLPESTVVADSLDQNQNGITTYGSLVNKELQYGYIGKLEEPQVILIKLKGDLGVNTDDKEILVEEPITKKTKLNCNTCGTIYKLGAKYCSECGTYLQT